MLFEIEQRFIALHRLVASAAARDLDEYLAATICKLGAVSICGNIERCVEIAITRRMAERNRLLSTFLKSYFKRGTNYDCDEIKSLLYKFSKQWGIDFEDFLQKTPNLKDSISGCYAARNLIAHGENQSLGPVILSQYYASSRTLIEGLTTSIQSNN